MVAHPRAPLRADQLRTLNQPRPVVVELEGAWPRALRFPSRDVAAAGPARRTVRGATPGVMPSATPSATRRVRVTQVQDAWRIDDEWWRSPISRSYYRLVLDDGSLRTVYRDEIADEWYEQRC